MITGSCRFRRSTMKRNKIEKIPFLSRFFQSLAEDLKIPGRTNKNESTIIKVNNAEEKPNG